MKGSKYDKFFYKLTTGMKMEIACAPKEEKENIREIAEVLHDIIEAVELGKDSIRHQKGIPYNNRALKQKEEKEFEKKLKEKLNEDRRKQRAIALKKLVEENKIEIEKKIALELQQK